MYYNDGFKESACFQGNEFENKFGFFLEDIFNISIVYVIWDYLLFLIQITWNIESIIFHYKHYIWILRRITERVSYSDEADIERFLPFNDEVFYEIFVVMLNFEFGDNEYFYFELKSYIFQMETHILILNFHEPSRIQCIKSYEPTFL